LSCPPGEQQEAHAELARREAQQDQAGGGDEAAAAEGEGVTEDPGAQDAIHHREARLQLAAW